MTTDPAAVEVSEPDRLRPRPLIHFAPLRNWMNDPNGLIEWRGHLHLFYQYNPHGSEHTDIAWGHASSVDLWQWRDHPVAMAPDPSGPDADGCWSGCAVVDDGVPRVVYTGVRNGAQLPCLATASDDRLGSWVRYAGNPVIPGPPAGVEVVAFRDHAVWRRNGAWQQVIGGGVAGRGGALFLYRSHDLVDWEYEGLLCCGDELGLDGAVWECPDVFMVDDTAVVIYSRLDDAPRHVVWMTGEIVGARFVPRRVGRLDAGERLYAAQSVSLSDGRRLMFGWLRETLEELSSSDRSRVGCMSLPRELTVDSDGLLISRPARELEGARAGVIAERRLDGDGSVAIELEGDGNAALGLRLAPQDPVDSLRAVLRGVGCPDIVIERRASTIVIWEGEACLAGAHATPGGVELDGREPMQVSYDRGIVEVFAGRCTPAAVICDRHGHYDRIDVKAVGPRGGDPVRVEVSVWQLGRPPVTLVRPTRARA